MSQPATHLRVLDTAIALGLVTWSVADSLAGGESWPVLVAGAVMAGLIALRRRYAAAVAAAVAAVMLGQTLLATPPEQEWLLVTVIVACYSLGAFEPRWTRSLAALAAVAVAVSVGILRDPSDSAGNIVPTVLIFLAAPWGAGRVLHGRQRRTEDLAERIGWLEREQELLAREAVTRERTRIAREMHDVVAHSLSVIAIQADAAEGALARDPDLAREPLDAVKRTAREALTEMRHLLGLLREDSDQPDRHPLPGLSSLETLVDQVRAAGLHVELEVHGRDEPLPGGADLSAYRVVQEALTNTLKHAGATRVDVRVEHRSDRVAITVQDDGTPGAVAGTDGRGLVGMRERATLHDGTLEAGPRPGGGYRVHLELPR